MECAVSQKAFRLPEEEPRCGCQVSTFRILFAMGRNDLPSGAGAGIGTGFGPRQPQQSAKQDMAKQDRKDAGHVSQECRQGQWLGGAENCEENRPGGEKDRKKGHA